MISDTDRFNRDCGFPAVTVVPPTPGEAPRITHARRLRAVVMGIAVEWDELAFEWIAPVRFQIERVFYSGPVAKLRVFCGLWGTANGGTTVVYEVVITPASLLGRLALPVSIGHRVRAITERVFQSYDEAAQRGLQRSQMAPKPALADGAAQRLATISGALVAEAAQSPGLVDKLGEAITTADEVTAARLRPYACADEWHANRSETLKLFLHATRAGLLDFSWDLVCPHCRGAKVRQTTLGALKPQAHCDTCQIDFVAHFDQSVELTFTPSPSIRPVTRALFCVGSPQNTPHIVAQQQLASGERRTVPLLLRPGRYRIRTPGLQEQHPFRVVADGPATLRIDLGATSLTEPGVAPQGELTFVNATATPLVAIVEHLAWSDQSTTAAEVTSLQLFRDLFSREVMRPGEQISVGTMTVVFTDLKNSTQLYQDIGDAPAFGRVLTHFEILKAAVDAENGCIVKTMGDAIMAVFPRPISAVRAMTHAQRWLRDPRSHALPAGVTVPPSSLRPLELKAGIHLGPCLAINQNDRLDYFGSTVNITARLCSASTGADVVLSSAVRADSEVAEHLATAETGFATRPDQAKLKGFGDALFEIWRVKGQDTAIR